jgi:release factor glutamine methyltransferase
MRKIIKRLISFFLIPATRWYLRKERKYTYHGTTVTVLPGVFHPGLFYSTRFLIDYLIKQHLSNTSFLELGCGTGLISVIAAKAGARVTASDLNSKAIQNVERNAKQNQVVVRSIYSDLFDDIEKQTFDWIIINPPYYARRPETDEGLAWYCGENFEYFQKLFTSLGQYIDDHSKVIMVLTKGSEVDEIKRMGKDHHFDFTMIEENKVFFDEKDFLFQILLTHTPRKDGNPSPEPISKLA